MLLRALCCAAAVCGYRGDQAAAAEWWAQAEAVTSARHGKDFFIKMMRADVLLHHGRRQEAAELLAEPPSSLVSPWRGWYGAVRAEALGPAAFADAEAVAEGGIYSAAVLARAQGRLEEALALFNECGATYQAARTALRMSRAESMQALARYAEWGLTPTPA
jgi:predicted Zn-dependent protease